MALLIATLASAAGCRDAGDEGGASAERAALAAFLDRAPASGEDPTVAAVRRFYAGRGHALAWSTGAGLGPHARELVREIGAAAEDGLDPEAYGAREIARRADELGDEPRSFAERWLARLPGIGRDAVPVDRRVELDVLLTDAYLSHAEDLAHGRVAARDVGADLKVPDDRVDVVASLERALAGSVTSEIDRLRPSHPEYAALRKALARYRELAARGGWKAVPGGSVVKPGEPLPAERRRALVERLAAEGFADAALAAGPPIYDEPLAEAIRRFQSLRGVESDGTLGESTVDELAVPAAARVESIRLNLERWRWLPGDLGRRHVRVNTAAFTLGVYEDAKQILATRVVVGREGSETPLFSDAMEVIVLNPYWNVPRGIVEDEILPAAGGNPASLAKKGYELVSAAGEPLANGDWSALSSAGSGLRIRQRPGPSNALGRIKFLFPNSHDVYLHDTPQDHLFARTDRAFSHGCIRVEKPLELAESLLRDAGEWRRDRLEQEIATSETKRIRLASPVPVYILYWTAVVNASGDVEFHQDGYGIDARLARALSGGGREARDGPARHPAAPRTAS